MEISLLKAVLSNISSFLSFSHVENKNSDLVKKYYQRTEEILKLLKPILDAIVDSEIAESEVLCRAFEELGRSLDALGNLLENWQPLSSKVFFVLEVELLITKIQNSVVDIFHFLKSSNQLLPEELSLSSLELCLQKFRHMRYEQTSFLIEEARGDLLGGVQLSAEMLVKIEDGLTLRSSEEILIEACALEKLKENAERFEGEYQLLDQMISLVTNMHERLVSAKQVQTVSPVPTPSGFCCPLSLELMADPVIVASGRTYERAAIKKWIDLGLTVCPMTRQPLGHTNLTPNHTVKDLIANWCNSNNVKLPETKSPVQPLPPLVHGGSGLMEMQNSHSLGQPTSLDFESQGSPEIVSSLSIESRADLSGTQVLKLVDELKSSSVDTQREATTKLRLLAKHNMNNRIVIGNSGAITLLVELLYSSDAKTQENAVTALLNLSLNDKIKTFITNGDAISPLIHVLETGNPEAKENAAATLYSISAVGDNKARIGKSGAIKPLVDLLGNGTPRGKRDAAIALYNLSIFHENKACIVEADAVKHLVELMDPAAGMVEKAVALLSNLATVPEGRTAIGQEGGIPVLVEVIELGTARGKENAAAALLQLCKNNRRFCSLVLKEGALPSLVALAQSGTPRAKKKSLELLSHIKNPP